MKGYSDKQSLIDEINKRGQLFIDEFQSIHEVAPFKSFRTKIRKWKKVKEI